MTVCLNSVFTGRGIDRHPVSSTTGGGSGVGQGRDGKGQPLCLCFFISEVGITVSTSRAVNEYTPGAALERARYNQVLGKCYFLKLELQGGCSKSVCLNYKKYRDTNYILIFKNC